MGKIAEIMGGLPMETLIAAPLTSVVDAQRGLAEVMIDYVNKVGYEKPGETTEARMLRFEIDKPVISEEKNEKNYYSGSWKFKKRIGRS